MTSILRRTWTTCSPPSARTGIDVLEGQPELASSPSKNELDRGSGGRRVARPDPSALEKTNDPVRIYLREMGTVPLLTREGEVDIAKRIERGQLSVLKALSRSPFVIRQILAIGEDLKRGIRSIKEIVVFDEEEITEETLQNCSKTPRAASMSCRSITREPTSWPDGYRPLSAKQKAREYRRCRCSLGREIVRISLIVRNLGLSNCERKRLIDRVNRTVDIMRSLDCQVSNLGKED